MVNTATRLTIARAAGGLSMRELGRLAGLRGRTHVEAIESGRSRNPEAATLGPIAEVLGVSLDWLVSGKGEEPDGARVRAAVAAARSRLASAAA